MTHGDFSRPGGSWPPVLVPTGRDFRWWDELSTEAINGDDGGTWTPTSPIRVGNAGIVTTTANTAISGTAVTYKGGRFSLGNNDFPTFAANQTRSIVFALGDTRPAASDVYQFDHVLDPYGIQILSNVGAPSALIPVPTRCMHGGATLTSVDVFLRIGQPHPGLPATQPGFAVYRANAARTAIQSLLAATNVQLAAATPDAYYNLAQVQSITLTCDQNNVVDSGLYAYFIQFFDETGVNALASSLNIWCAARFNYTATIVDMRFE